MKEISNPGSVHLYGKNTSKDIALAPPKQYLIVPDDIMVSRAFGFVDLCNFSAYTTEAGPPAAFEALRQFRSLVRVVASTRGVRIANWLGDGAMLVGLDAGAVAATVVELVARSERALRGSVTYGSVLLFEGDDHIGAPVNLASRLCEIADKRQVLTTKSSSHDLPSWLVASPIGPVSLRGLDEREIVVALSVPPEVEESLRPTFHSGQVPVVNIPQPF